MTPERWQRIDGLFRAAIEREGQERQAFLDLECRQSPNLRREVDALLAADQQADRFLEEAVEAEAARLGPSDEITQTPTAIDVSAAQASAVDAIDRGPDADGQLNAGRRIGDYQIVRRIGSGGMGSVYLAERADQRYRQKVAIKILKRGLDSAELQRRFRQERRILASLEHPNIARLLDAASSEDGLPCFVMEYVEGTPIDRYCDDRQLSVTERLKLFRTVCEAVQAAHRNLIVHRDLKPSNILVTADGTPKLLDFGVAKLLDPESFPQTVVPTALPYHPMTPSYASPEQVRGGTITTASDVYSLGVLLYRLLTGRPPYRVDPRRSTEMERLICEIEPVKPSLVGDRSEQTAESPGLIPEGSIDKLRRRLSGDLDTVLLKALAKEPEQRYGSVDRLSEDLKRHLEGLPILARRPTWRYRTGKFLRRHRTGVLMAVLSLALLLGGIVTTTWQARVASSQRAAAEVARVRAEEVSSFLEELFQLGDRAQAEGETVTARQLLDRAAEQLTQEAWDQPEAQAALLTTIGRSYHGLGLYEEADQHLQAALDIWRQAVGPEHLEVAQTLDTLAHTNLERSQFAEAEDGLQEALEMRRRLLGAEHLTVAESLNNLAQVRQAQGDLESAESLLSQSLAIRRQQLSAEHPDLANTVNNLAGVMTGRGDHAGAEALFRESLNLRRQQLGPRHPSVAESLNNLAAALYRQRKFAPAETVFREALDARRSLHGEAHPMVARTLANLATTLLDQERPSEAEPLLLEALALQEQFLGQEHPRNAFALNNLGRIHEARGDDTEAEAHYRHALQLRRQALPEGHRLIAVSALDLGQLLLDRGDLQEAETLLQEALEIQQASTGDAWRRAEAESAWAGYLMAIGESSQAKELLKTSLSILDNELGPEDRRTRRARQRWETL